MSDPLDDVRDAADAILDHWTQTLTEFLEALRLPDAERERILDAYRAARDAGDGPKPWEPS